MHERIHETSAQARLEDIGNRQERSTCMTPVSPAEEVHLLQRIAQQDQTAMSLLYDRYARPLYSLAFKMLGTAEEAEEVVLDVFCQVWKSAQRYDISRGRVDTWMFLMLRSRALDRLRKRKRQAKAVVVSTLEAQVQAAPQPDEVLLMRERRDQVQAALDQLPSEQRQVLELAYFSGLTHAEMSATLGLALGTVKTRVRLGLNKLRRLLDEVD